MTRKVCIGRFVECSLRPPRVMDGQTHCGQKMYEIDVLSAGPSACPLARSLTHSRAHGKEIYVKNLNASISHSFNPLCGGGSNGDEKLVSIKIKNATAALVY